MGWTIFRRRILIFKHKLLLSICILGQKTLSACCLLCWTSLNWFMGHFGRATYQYLARPAMKKSIVPKLKSTLRSYCPNVYTVSWTSFLLELNHDNVCLPSSFYQVFHYQFSTVQCIKVRFTVFSPVDQVHTVQWLWGIYRMENLKISPLCNKVLGHQFSFCLHGMAQLGEKNVIKRAMFIPSRRL